MSSLNVKVIATLFLSLMVLSLSATTAAFAARGNAPNSLLKAPIYLHFKPKSITAVLGSTVTVTLKVVDKGTSSFTATSCELFYKLGTSGAWTKAASCLTSSDFPITINSGQTLIFSGTEKVPSNCSTCTGVYEWKLIGIGTYNGVPAETHTGKIIVTVT